MVPYKKNPNMIITIIHYGWNNVIYSYKYIDEPIKYKSCITLVIAKDLVMSIHTTLSSKLLFTVNWILFQSTVFYSLTYYDDA